MARRQRTKIPVYVVEDHNDALPFIYRNIGSSHLPFEDNLLVHFDSHPDLLIDKNLPEDSVWEKDVLYDKLSIENWILPGCYSGQFSKVCWIKPNWSTQIPEGTHKVAIGKHKDKIRVGTPLYYYLSDGIFVDKAELTNLRQFELFVATLPTPEEAVDVPKSVLSEKKPWVLDIDLDFFSTQNPFLALFAPGNLYERLRPIFSLEFDTTKDWDYRTYVAIAQRHCKHLKHVDQVFQHMIDQNSSLDNYLLPLPEEMRKQMNRLIDIVNTEYEKTTFDWSILYNAGMTCDQCALPHHVSTEEEIKASLGHFEQFLRRLPCPPTIVTVARSTEDDYCPRSQVDWIQDSVLEILENVYGKLQVQKEYKEDGSALENNCSSQKPTKNSGPYSYEETLKISSETTSPVDLSSKSTSPTSHASSREGTSLVFQDSSKESPLSSDSSAKVRTSPVSSGSLETS